jgi:glycosyltransferase involved in cell wall biosynthesis
MSPRLRRSATGDPIRVVALVDSLERPGGGERLALEGVARLDPERFERTLCVTRWRAETAGTPSVAACVARLEQAGVTLLPLNRSARLAVWAFRPLLARLRDSDVVHGHMFGSNVWASVLGRIAGVPAIVAHEHMWGYTGGWKRSLVDRELIARLSDAFIAVSEVGRRQMIETERIPPADIVLLRNGIETLPRVDRRAARRALGLPEDAQVVGSVGHLRSEKAFEVLIAAAAAARGNVPGLRIIIAGEGPERGRLEGLISELGLSQTVDLLGARDDVATVLGACDVAVCCSDFEGGPLSVMEYMDAALPVVASEVGGLPELVEDGVTGVLVPPRDPAAIARALKRLLGDPELRSRMGVEARARRERDYDIDSWARALEGLYERLLLQRA